MNRIIIIFLLLASTSLYNCQRTRVKNKYIKELKGNMVLLPSNNPLEFEDELFTDLDKYIDNANVIALGEAVHGSSTIFEFKHRFLKYLVENKNCRSLCYEFNYEKSIDINNYILYGKGNIDSLIHDLYWIQANNEFKKLIDWLREHNSRTNDTHKVHFIGIDNQVDMYNALSVVSRIINIEPALTSLLADEIHKITIMGRPEYREMSNKEYESLMQLIQTLAYKTRVYLKNNESLIRHDNARILTHLTDGLIMSHEFLFNAYNGGPNNRDEFMADNVLWANNFFGDSTSRTALWAHNAHVCNDPEYYSNGGASMGHYLKKKAGYKYMITGTSFNKGQLIAVEEDISTGKDTPPHVINIDTIPLRGSVNELFYLAGEDNFYINLQSLNKKGMLYNYLDSIRPFMGIGDFYIGNTLAHYSNDRTVNLIEGYDIIFHLSETKPLSLTGKWVSTDN